MVNPKRNWLANWNNLPAAGWTNGDGPARERENGNLHRIRLIQSLVRKVAKNPSYKRSRKIELTSGTTAQQFPFVDRRKLKLAKKRAKGIGGATIAELMRWDGNYNETADDGTVAPGVSIWEAYKTQLEAILLKPYGKGAETLAVAPAPPTSTTSPPARRSHCVSSARTRTRERPREPALSWPPGSAPTLRPPGGRRA